MTETRLLVELSDTVSTGQSLPPLNGIDGLVFDPVSYPLAAGLANGDCDPATWVLRGCSPLGIEGWSECSDATWICDDGLQQTAAMRDGWPSLSWVPRIEVSKAEVIYQFSDEAHGDGFKTYRPNTAAIQGYLTGDGGRSLFDWIEDASSRGFETVWLHAAHAAANGTGLDLDMLEKIHGRFSGKIWLSGGATSLRHIETLAREGGVEAVILPKKFVDECGPHELTAVLGAEVESDGSEVDEGMTA